MYVIILQNALFTDGISEVALVGARMSLGVQFEMQSFLPIVMDVLRS